MGNVPALGLRGRFRVQRPVTRVTKDASEKCATKAYKTTAMRLSVCVRFVLLNFIFLNTKS